MTMHEQEDLKNFVVLLPMLARQQSGLTAFVKQHEWFLKRGGQILIKSSGVLDEEIESEITSSQVKVHVQPDRSIYDAWNQCMDALEETGLTNQAYVTFLGLDDQLDMNYTNATADVTLIQPELDFVYGNSCHDLNGISYPHESPTVPKLFGKNDFVFDVPHPGMFNRWETIRKYRFDTQFRLAADFDFYIGIALDNNLQWKKLDLLQATLGGEGISASLNSKQIYLNEWAIIEKKRGVRLSSSKLHTQVTAWLALNPVLYKWLRKTWWKIKSMTR